MSRSSEFYAIAALVVAALTLANMLVVDNTARLWLDLATSFIVMVTGWRVLFNEKDAPLAALGFIAFMASGTLFFLTLMVIVPASMH